MLKSTNVYKDIRLIGRVVELEGNFYYVDASGNISLLPAPIVQHALQCDVLEECSEIFVLNLLNIDTSRLQLGRSDAIYRALYYPSENKDVQFWTMSDGGFVLLKDYFVSEMKSGNYVICNDDYIVRFSVTGGSVTSYSEIDECVTETPLSKLTVAWSTKDNLSYVGMEVYEASN